MSNFTTIDLNALESVVGGGVEAGASVKAPGVEASGNVKTTQDPVKQYGKSELLACQQQANDNFGGWFGDKGMLKQQLDSCVNQFGGGRKGDPL